MLLKCTILVCFLFFATHGWSQTDIATTGNEMVFVSDTQGPLFLDVLLRKTHRNREATRKIFSDIVRRHPATVFILGDVVSLGYSNKQWKSTDRYLDSLRKNGTQVSAVLGNHEMLLCARTGQKKFRQRFPNHVKTGYISIVDSVAVVLLNSNFNHLTAAENAVQTLWYKLTLDSLDADSSVLFIISCCHHSPFSNSKVVGSSLPVQNNFVKSFFLSKKSLLFLSGHSHNFECFKKQGKDFLVIGGGGGVEQPLRAANIDLPDVLPNYKPMFHYLSIHRKLHNLQIVSVFLKRDFSGFSEGEKLSVSLPPNGLNDPTNHQQTGKK